MNQFLLNHCRIYDGIKNVHISKKHFQRLGRNIYRCMGKVSILLIMAHFENSHKQRFKWFNMKTKLYAFLIILLLIFCEMKAQSSIEGYSINPKLGAYNWLGNGIGLAQGCEINILSKKLIFSLDYYYCSIILDIPTIHQIDFLIGEHIGDKYLRFQYQGGIGAAWGVNKGDRIGTYFPLRYEKEKFITIGIPLKLGFKFMPIDFLSIGIDFQVNLNVKYPIYMTMASIEIGRIRNKIDVP